MQQTFTVTSKKQFEIIDINKKVKDIVSLSRIKQGLCNIYTSHASSAIIVNENYDQFFKEDLLNHLKKLIPKGNYKHDKEEEVSNTDAHIKASIIGPQETIPINNNKLLLGKWQDLMFIDFDGPRKNRKITVTILEDISKSTNL